MNAPAEDPLEKASKKLPVDPSFIFAGILGFAIIFEITLLEHAVILGLVGYFVYKRTLQIRQGQKFAALAASSRLPPNVLQSQLAQTAPLPPAKASVVPLDAKLPMPYWDVFRDWDRTRWLNACIESVWPQVCLYIENTVIPIVNPLLDQYKMILEKLKLTSVKLGHIPIVVEAVKVYPPVGQYLTMDFKFSWKGDPEFVCLVGIPGPDLDVRIEDVECAGIMRARMQIVPCGALTASMGIQLVAKPSLEYNVRIALAGSKKKGGAKLIPEFVENTISDIILNSLVPLMVYPKWMHFPIMDKNLPVMKDWEKGYQEQPTGVLVVKVVGAEKLINVDTLGKSDPYCTLRIDGLEKVEKTKTIDNNLNPTWNEKFVFGVCNRDIQLLHFELYDEDMGFGDAKKKDDSLGNLAVKFDLIEHGQLQDVTTPLSDVKTGQLHFQLLWLEVPEGRQNEIENLKMQGLQLIEHGESQSANWVQDGTTQMSSMTRMRSMRVSGRGAGSGLSPASPARPPAGPATSSATTTSNFNPVSAVGPGPGLLPDLSTKVWKQSAGIRKTWTQRFLVVTSTSVRLFDAEGDAMPKRVMEIPRCAVSKRGLQRGGAVAMYVMDIFVNDTSSGTPEPYHVKLGFENEATYNEVYQRITQGGGTSMAPPPE